MTFRLTTVLWLFALAATAMGVVGGAGLVVAAAAVTLWAAPPHISRLSFVQLMGIAIVILIVAVQLLLLPAYVPRHSAREYQCTNNMKQLSLALFNSQDTLGTLPQAVLRDDAGEPLHSWRTLVLPYIEEGSLYDSIDLEQPWDSPGNSAAIAGRQPELFTCPSCWSRGVPCGISYFAVVGPKAVWPIDGVGRTADITDDPATTILLMEDLRETSWAEPGDLTFDDALSLLTSPVVPEKNGGHKLQHGYFYKPRWVRTVAMVDGSVHQLRCPLPEEFARAILTANGGERVSLEQFEQVSKPELDKGKIARLVMFLVVAVMPAVRWFRPNPQASGES